ncbi:MAG: hypothetical protein ACRDJ3_11450 [Solirubrobacteraceae bacterium]
MKTRSKALSIALCALALSVAGAASASAAEWRVANNPLVESAGLASKPAVTKVIKVEYAPGVYFECTGVELKNGKITAHTTGSIEHLVLRECANNGNCIVPSTIESKPLTIEAALGSTSPEDKLTLKPTTGTTFMEFNITGLECQLFGSARITGKMKNLLPKGQTELAEQELQLHTEGGELAWSSAPVTVTGTIKLKLTTSQTWSFH